MAVTTQTNHSSATGVNWLVRRPGAVVSTWIVYNEGLDTERAPSRFALPADPLSLSRALIVKYSHTFTF